MKRPYEKPKLIIEDFSMMEHIARDCAFSDESLAIGFRAQPDCGFSFDGENILYQNMTICTDDLGWYDPGDVIGIYNGIEVTTDAKLFVS